MIRPPLHLLDTVARNFAVARIDERCVQEAEPWCSVYSQFTGEGGIFKILNVSCRSQTPRGLRYGPSAELVLGWWV
jgi:hypothetical protein